MSETMDQESTPQGELVEIPVDLGEANTPAEFSNFMGVQFHEGVFVLTFGQFFPPFILGDEVRKRERIEAMDSVQIRPVARVVLTPDKARDVVRALSENIEKNAPQEENHNEHSDGNASQADLADELDESS